MVPALKFWLFGTFQALHGETPLTHTFTPRLQAFVSYLLLHRFPAPSRQQLAFHFWPDTTDAQTRANLRKTVYRLRKAVPDIEHYLDTEEATLSWRPETAFWLDVGEFESRLQQAEAAEGPQQAELLDAALAVYKGELLPDLYDDWVLPLRERLRQCYLDALDRLVVLQEAERNYAAASDRARQLLRADPLRESAYRRLMRLHALSGDVPAALHTYHSCATLLDQELGVEPGPATQQGYRQLLNRQTRPNQLSPSRSPRQLPLVGRRRSWEALLAAWRAAAAGKPQVAIVAGEAGIGKTRLAEELLTWSRRQGIIALRAACFGGGEPLPLTPVADWLRAEAAQRALPRLAPRWRREVARVLPELLAADPDLKMPRPMTEAWQRHHLFGALAEAVMAAGQPLLLFLDDLHWADADTLEWLHFLARHKADHRFLLLATIRSEAVTPDHPLVPWQQALSRLLRVRGLSLGRLDEAATSALAAHVAGRTLEEVVAAALYEETEGNPLFIVEMVRVGWRQAEWQLPEMVRSVIEVHLRQLSPQAQELLGLAATIGRSFTFPLLAAASPVAAGEVVDALDELWQRQVVREHGDGVYDFSHDKLREVALAQLSLARRQWWHRCVAEALETVFAGNLDSFYGQIASHYEASGRVEQAITYYHRAATKARGLYATDEALDAYRKALALVGASVSDNDNAAASAQRTALLTEMGEVLALTGEYEEARAAFTEALAAAQIGPTEKSRLHRLVAETYRAQNQYEAALAGFLHAEAVLPPWHTLAPGEEQEQWFELQLLRLEIAYGQADVSKMEELMAKLDPVFEQHGSPVQRVRFLYSAIELVLRRARYAPPLEEALSYQERMLAASNESGDIALVNRIQFAAGSLHLWRGAEKQAETHFERALEMAAESGYVEMRLLSLTYLAVLNRQRGARAVAESYAQQSLAVARAGNWRLYVAAAEAILAWVAWRSRNLDEAWRRGQAALDLWRDSHYPFQWLALWPLIDIAVHRGKIETAVTFADALLSSLQQRFPQTIGNALESVLQAGESSSAIPHIQEALRLARHHNYL